MATVSESDYNIDSQNLQSAQDNLLASGLKFQSQPSSTDLTWDRNFQKAYTTQNPNARQADEVAALKAFLKTGNDYLKKYGSMFHLTHKDGTDEVKNLDEAAAANLKAQIALVKSELAKTDPKGSAPKGDGHKAKTSLSES